MAQWKKIVVSGSNISQLANDVGYVINQGSSGVVLNGAFTGSFSGSAVLPTLTQGNGISSFTYNGSSPATVTVQADSTTGGNIIPVNINSIGVGLDVSKLTGPGIEAINDAGFNTLGVNVDDTTIEIASDNIQIKDKGVTAAKLDDVFTDNGGATGSFGSSTQVPVLDIDAQGRITSASLSTISTTLSISGDTGTDSVSLIDGTLDFQGTSGITTTVTDDKVTFALNSGVVSGSSISSPGQGQVALTTNGVAASTIDLGLEITDDVTFNNLTLTGDAEIDGNLTVNGTLTYLNTTNLEIKDKYILLNSGSTDPDTAGLVVDQGSGAGDAFLFDATDLRWGVNKNISATTGSANTEAHVSLVIDENDPNHVDEAYYQKSGNIKVTTGGDIYIYT